MGRQTVVEHAVVDPARLARPGPAATVAVERLVAIIGIPVGVDIEGHALVAEIGRVVAQQVVVALGIPGEVNRAHPAAPILKDAVAPAVIRYAAENRDGRVCRNRENDRVFGAGAGAQIDVGDGISVRLLGRRRRGESRAEDETRDKDFEGTHKMLAFLFLCVESLTRGDRGEFYYGEAGRTWAKSRPRRLTGLPGAPGSPIYSPREVGSRRVPRQPGQIRKEAALTSVSRVVRPASHFVSSVS